MHPLAAALILAECIAMPTQPHGFFNTGGVGYGRLNARREFVIERVVRGPMKEGDVIPVEEERECHRLPAAGELALVSKACWNARCVAQWAYEPEAPRLLEWFARSHRETHVTVLAKAVDWAEGRLSRDDLQAWLDTVIVEPRGEWNEQFTEELIDALQNLERIGKRREFVKRARAFPSDLTNDTEEVEEQLLALLEP